MRRTPPAHPRSRGPRPYGAVRPPPSGPLTLLLLGLALPGPFAFPDHLGAQQTGDLAGRVVDRGTGAPIPDVALALQALSVPGPAVTYATATDHEGLFLLDGLPAGEYRLVVRHIAYGEHTEPVSVVPGVPTRLEVRLSEQAIELEPLVVEGLRPEELEARARGTRRNIVTRDVLLRTSAMSGNLGQALSQAVPGIRVRRPQARVGELICVEFRSPRSLVDQSCKPPLVFVDGVRAGSSAIVLTTMPVGDIRQVEVIPPGEAGVQYGTDSRYGVVLIETLTSRTARAETEGEEESGGEGVASGAPSSGRYDWSFEARPYPWRKVFGSALLANAAALGLAVAATDPCLDFDGISDHFLEPECGGWGTAASRLALYLVPSLTVSLVTRRVGETELSRGRMWATGVAAMIVTGPSLIMALSDGKDAFEGARWVGGTLLVLGVPVAATLADRLLRRVRINGS